MLGLAKFAKRVPIAVRIHVTTVVAILGLVGLFAMDATTIWSAPLEVDSFRLLF